MGESKPDTPRRIRVDADIKYAVSAYPRIRVDVALQCSRGKGAGGGWVYSLIRPLRGCAAGQGMVFDQPRPRAFPFRHTHFLREKLWGRGWFLTSLFQTGYKISCVSGISSTIDLISSINFVYKSNVYRRRAFSPLS